MAWLCAGFRPQLGKFRSRHSNIEDPQLAQSFESIYEDHSPDPHENKLHDIEPTFQTRNHSIPEPHVPVLSIFVELTKILNDFFAPSSEARHTSIILKKLKELMCLSCHVKKIHLPSWDSNPKSSTSEYSTLQLGQIVLKT